MPILFSPPGVADVLGELPALAETLKPPVDEGEPSAAFPSALRKTNREIYRFLANTHYEHLADALGLFEKVFAAGCVFPDLVRTTSRQQFMSVTAEVLAAEHFLNRGYMVSPIPRTGERGADIHVVGHNLDAAIEIYSPREWMAVDAWTDALKDVINSADIAANYVARADTRIRLTTPPDRFYSPWEIAEVLRLTQREVLANIRRGAYRAMERLRPWEWTYDHRQSALETTFSLSDVSPSSPDGPVRFGSVSAPGPSGYSPSGVFRTIVERAVKKSKRRQTATSVAPTRALLVNLMHTHVADDLLHPAHHREATEALGDLDPREHGLDLIAFYVRAKPEGIRLVFSVYENERLTEQQLLRMLGDGNR